MQPSGHRPGTKNTSDNAVTWTATGNNFGGWNGGNYYGQQFGSGSAKFSGTFSAPEIIGKKITSIGIRANAGTANVYTLSVKVGATTYSPASASVTKNSSATSNAAVPLYTFTGNSTGAIVVTVASTSNVAFYLNSISITYEPTSIPTLSTSVQTITGLDYITGNGPSLAQTFTIDGTNLDGSEEVVIGFDNVTSPFEMSKDGITYNSILYLPAYTGISNTIHIRLQAGKTAGNYTDAVKIVSSYTAADITIPISGVVTAPPPVPVVSDAELIGTVGVPFTFQVIATGNPDNYFISGDFMPNGVSLENETGILSGTPTNAGQFISGVKATNFSGTSAEGVIIFEIAKGTQTLASFADVSKQDNDTPFIFPETTNAGLNVAYTSSNLNVATVVGNTITITGIGTVLISAANSGNANWNPFSQSITLTVTSAPELYAGEGTFTLVTDITNLTDGYYVITSEASAFVMTNGRSGSATSGYFLSDAIAPEGNTIVDPVVAKVWRIETNGSGKTIYNDVTGKYVGWNTGNAASIEDAPADSNRWIFTYADDKFTVKNVATPIRQLSYNSGAPRFAAYDNAGQQELQLYKLSTPVTWNGTAWTNTTGPDATLDAVITGDYTTTSDLAAKSLTVNSGIFTVTTGTTLTVENAIVNNSGAANFIVENDAVVLQSSNDANTGVVTVKRNSSPLFRMDYTLWSSPVTGQNLRAFSPATLFNRFYSYDTETNVYVQEIVTTEDVNTINFSAGSGYLIRMPNNWIVNSGSPADALPYEGAFKGTLNNGTLTKPLSLLGSKYNLVGNPYPSPISISTLMSVNTSQIEGTIYMWRKKGSAALPAGSGYVAYNALGQNQIIGDAQNGSTIPSTLTHIQAGQGFFVTAKAGAAAVTFNNSMRESAATEFFKSSVAVEMNRLWLSLSDATAPVGHVLVGYTTDATQGVDSNFDAPYFNDSPLALTSIINNNEYSIQGRALPFTPTDVVPLGFKTDVAGSYSIALTNYDGVFDNDQDVFLKDNATNQLHNLKTAAYTFNSVAGVFNQRFELRYQGNLDTNNPSAASSSILIAVKNQQIKINAGSVTMEKVELIDVAGRVIYTVDGINATTATIENLVASNQILIVRISTKENGVVNQKIIF